MAGDIYLSASGELVDHQGRPIVVAGAPGAPGPPIADGDKGDIVVTGSGATWTVEAGAITAAKVAADVATQAELDAHVNDTTAAHTASAIAFTPTGSVAANTVQAAIAEVASEAGGATPAASAVTFSPTGTIAATNVQAAIAEVAAEAGTGGGAGVDLTSDQTVDGTKTFLDSPIVPTPSLGTHAVPRAFLESAINDVSELVAGTPTEVLITPGTSGAPSVIDLLAPIARQADLTNLSNTLQISMALLYQTKAARSRLDADVSSTEATTWVDSGLSVGVVAGKTYELDGFLRYSASATGDLRIRFTATTATVAGSWNGVGIRSGGTTTTETSNWDSRGFANDQNLGGTGTDNLTMATANLNGTVRVTGANGTLKLQFRQGTLDAAVTTILRADSRIRLLEMT